MHSRSRQLDPHPLLHLLPTFSGSGRWKENVSAVKGTYPGPRGKAGQRPCVLSDASRPPWGHLNWCNYKLISAPLRTSASPCSRGELERKAIPCPHRARRMPQGQVWKCPSSGGSQQIWGCFFLVALRRFFFMHDQIWSFLGNFSAWGKWWRSIKRALISRLMEWKSSCGLKPITGTKSITWVVLYFSECASSR